MYSSVVVNTGIAGESTRSHAGPIVVAEASFVVPLIKSMTFQFAPSFPSERQSKRAGADGKPRKLLSKKGLCPPTGIRLPTTSEATFRRYVAFSGQLSDLFVSCCCGPTNYS
jgi:hypothetical protein